MKLSAFDLTVAINTLHNSLRFEGAGFMYTTEARERVRERLTEVLRQIPVEMVNTSSDEGA